MGSEPTWRTGKDKGRKGRMFSVHVMQHGVDKEFVTARRGIVIDVSTNSETVALLTAGAIIAREDLDIDFASAIISVAKTG